ncbi:MAG TPA: DUF3168 domain-containing protein [Vicinamibacterales bacterium]
MTIEQIVVERLLSIVAVTSLVSTRVYLDKLPQSPVYPCVRVTLIDELEDYHLRGGGLKTVRIQVDGFAKELSGIDPYAMAAAVSDAIHGDDAGSGLSGWIGEFGSPALQVQACLRVDRRRYYDPEELRVLTMSQDYRVTYRA